MPKRLTAFQLQHPIIAQFVGPGAEGRTGEDPGLTPADMKNFFRGDPEAQRKVLDSIRAAQVYGGETGEIEVPIQQPTVEDEPEHVEVPEDATAMMIRRPTIGQPMDIGKLMTHSETAEPVALAKSVGGRSAGNLGDAPSPEQARIEKLWREGQLTKEQFVEQISKALGIQDYATCGCTKINGGVRCSARRW